MWNPLISPFAPELSAEKTAQFSVMCFFPPAQVEQPACQGDCRFLCTAFSKQWNKQPILICCQHLACASLSAARRVFHYHFMNPGWQRVFLKVPPTLLEWNSLEVISPRYFKDLLTSQGLKCPEVRRWNDSRWPGSPRAERWEEK